MLRSKLHTRKFDEISLAVTDADLHTRSDIRKMFTSQFNPRKRYLKYSSEREIRQTCVQGIRNIDCHDQSLALH